MKRYLMEPCTPMPVPLSSKIGTIKNDLSRLVQIFIKGNRFVLHHIDPNEVVLTLKQQIFDRQGFPVLFQNLYFEGRRLSNDRTLASYNITEGTTLFLSTSTFGIIKKKERSRLETALDTLDVSRICSLLKNHSLYTHTLLPFHFLCRMSNIQHINFGTVSQICALLASHFSVDDIDNLNDVPELQELDCTNRYIKGDSCLHISARMNWCDMTLLLLSLKANINIVNTVDGDTPLHVALRHGNILVAQSLLQLGANLDSRNKASKTPLDVFVEAIDHDLLVECTDHNSQKIFLDCPPIKLHEFTSVTSDVSFQVENRVISCNKAVLVARSKYFHTLLSTTSKASTDLINLHGVPYSEFSTLVLFLYTNRCTITFENIAPLFVLAQRFMVSDLQKTCKDFLKSALLLDYIFLQFFYKLPSGIMACPPLMEIVGKRLIQALLHPPPFLGREKKVVLLLQLLDFVKNGFLPFKG